MAACWIDWTPSSSPGLLESSSRVLRIAGSELNHMRRDIMSIAVPIGARPADRDKPIGLAILGSTGSIGCQTLEVVDRQPGKFRVITLAAGANASLLEQQAAKHRPALIALDDENARSLSVDVPLVSGIPGLI